MNRRLFLAAFLPQVTIAEQQQNAIIRQPSIFRPGVCSNCGHDRLAPYITPNLTATPNPADANTVTIDRDYKAVLMLLICVRCHVVSENWTMPKGEN